LNPAPPAAEGKRFGEGTRREKPSISRGVYFRYLEESASGSYHWISTTMYCQPLFAILLAM